MMKKFYLCIFLFLLGMVYAGNQEPIVVNATITATQITLSPDTIAPETPFIIHIINKSGTAVELENSDTSVEIYTGMDKTFKVGLASGSYKFFNDFNPKTKIAVLHVSNQVVNNNSQITVVDKPTEKLTDNPSATPNTTKLSEIFFIVWRESIEALLVVGIVFSWIKHLKQGQKKAMLFLWMGVGLGLLCAAILGFILVEMSSILSGNAQNYLQASMTFIAAVMIVYMVKWMRSHGRNLKSDMLGAISKNSDNQWNISILVVVAIAIAREGSEAMIFIYAIGFGETGSVSLGMYATLILGVITAIASVYLFQLSNKIFSWKYFFKVTEILLLLLGGGLLLNCVDLLVSAGLIPVLHAKIWDSSFFISDGGHIAPMLASLIGYRAAPSLIDLITYIGYCLIIYFMFKAKPQPDKPQA